MKIFKKIICVSLSLLVSAGYAENSNMQDLDCEINKTPLNLYKKNDFQIISKTCSDEDPYVINYLSNNTQTIFVNKYSLDIGKWTPKLAAVSVYKKSNKPLVLITLHSQLWDTPTISGTSYDVNLYEVHKNNGKISLKDISKILGDQQSGLDGVSDDYMHFKLKNIASIKKWLDKNYN